MSERPTILFATLAAGGSHVSSATAMAQAIAREAPDRYETPIREIMVDYGFGEWVDKHKASWRWQLEHPWSITWGQPIINRFPGITQAMQRRSLRDFARVAATRLNDERPALIVGNHPFMVTALTMSQKEFGLEVPVLHFQTTTLDTTSLWADPGAERYICGSPRIQNELADMGVDPSRVDVVGYPVRQEFLRDISKSEMRAELGLADTPTCLVMLGGEGVGGSPRELVSALRAINPPVQVVVITGRNPTLEAGLRKDFASDDLVRVEGFVDNVADFQIACDIFVGKTGPASTFETMAVGRPILAPRKSGTSENRILAFVERQGLGHFTPTLSGLTNHVAAYLREPERLEEVRQRSQAYDFPDMASRVARYILHYAEQRTPDLSLLGKGIH